MNNSFGKSLKHYRLAKGWSQTQLADAANISFATVNRLEGQHNSPKMLTIGKLASALGIEPNDLLNLAAQS